MRDTFFTLSDASLDLCEVLTENSQRWFSEALCDSEMKWEYGEEEPIGAKSVTAPATVSGEQTR